MKHQHTNDSSRWRTTLRLFAMMSVAGCAVAGSTSAQGTHAMSKLPNIVLVHGAWGDGSSWDAVIQRLQQDGFHVSAVQLTLTSFEEDVARTRA